MADKIVVTSASGLTLRPPVRIVNPTKEQLRHRGHLLTETKPGSGVYGIEGAVSFKCGESLMVIGDLGADGYAKVADAVTGETGQALRATSRAAKKKSADKK